jgi:hydrogenase maturation factor HypE
MYEQYIKETTEENPPEYEELKSRIEQKIRDNKFSQKVDELIETLKDQSKVEIFREEMEKE